MLISTKGRYALRVMIDLAEHQTDGFVPLKVIAARQEISEKYLESIVSVLSKNDLLLSLRGKGGGYKLARLPEEYTIGDILRLTEGSFAPVACLEKQPNTCAKAGECKTLGMWEGFQKVIEEYFDGITIADLADKNAGADNYII